MAYKNGPVASMYLCRNSERALTGYILYSNDVLFRMWDHLEDAIREGTPRWKQTFGIEGGIFDHFFRTEEAKQTFLQGMHGFGLLSSPKVVEAFTCRAFAGWSTWVERQGIWRLQRASNIPICEPWFSIYLK